MLLGWKVHTDLFLALDGKSLSGAHSLVLRCRWCWCNAMNTVGVPVSVANALIGTVVLAIAWCILRHHRGTTHHVSHSVCRHRFVAVNA